MATVTGTNGDDFLDDGQPGDVFLGLGGNDEIEGLAGNETLEGGDGNDTLNGLLGDDVLRGDAGNDVLLASGGSDTMFGGSGDDTIDLNLGETGTADGGDGTDVLDLSDVDFDVTVTFDPNDGEQGTVRFDDSQNNEITFTDFETVLTSTDPSVTATLVNAPDPNSSGGSSTPASDPVDLSSIPTGIQDFLGINIGSGGGVQSEPSDGLAAFLGLSQGGGDDGGNGGSTPDPDGGSGGSDAGGSDTGGAGSNGLDSGLASFLGLDPDEASTVNQQVQQVVDNPPSGGDDDPIAGLFNQDVADFLGVGVDGSDDDDDGGDALFNFLFG